MKLKNLTRKIEPYVLSALMAVGISGLKGYSQNIEDEPKYYLGFSLMPNHNTAITYAIIKVTKNKTQKQIITKRSFLVQALGKQTSKANSKLENLMEKNGIKNCTTDNCPILDDLWKLTYSLSPEKILNPKKTESDTLGPRYDILSEEPDMGGWSNTTAPSMNKPSKEQLNFLKQFGINKVGDFFYGENAFKLLKSVQNESWVAQYKNL